MMQGCSHNDKDTRKKYGDGLRDLMMIVLQFGVAFDQDGQSDQIMAYFAEKQLIHGISLSINALNLSHEKYGRQWHGREGQPPN